MSYSRRQLYAMGEPLGDSATRREVGGKIVYGGGGGGGNPETQRQIVDLPEWAKPYGKEGLGKAQALTETPYQIYGGERVAQFTPLQQQAFNQSANQQVAGQIGFGSGLAGLAGMSSFGDSGTAANFMSPYMDSVVRQQMESAQRQADIAATQRGAAAVRAGAFGGSRQAVENAEAARALASQKGQIQAQGLQSAFERAQQQFNQEQATRLNAAQTLGQLGQQQFGQQMDITGQQAQFGQQQRAATQDILSQQYQDFLNQQRAPYDQLAFMTSMIRGTPMGQTTTMYQPAPSAASQLVGLGTAAAGLYGVTQGKAAGGEVHSYAKGGGISSLNQPQIAALASRMSDQQLGQTAKTPSITDIAKMTLAAEAQRRAETRRLAMAETAKKAQQQPQGTVAEEQLASIGGLSSLGAPNLERMGETTMASGGIIAFQNRGAVPIVLPAGTPYEEVETIRMQNPDQTVVVEGQSDLYRDTIRPFFTGYSDSARALGRPDLVEGLSQRGTTAGVAATPSAARTAAPATAAPRVDLRKGTEDPRVGLEGLTPAKAKAEQAAAKGKPGTDRGTATGAAPSGLAQLSRMQTTTAEGLGGLKAQLEKVSKATETAAQENIERVKKGQEEDGVAGLELEKRLKKREADLEGAKNKNASMAVFKAGLAILSGNAANGLENVGKGALVGTEAYIKGVERIDAEREKLDEAFARIDDIRRGERKANRKELNDALTQYNAAKISTEKALYDFGSKALDISRDDIKLSVDTYLKQQQIAASNRPSGEIQLIERIMAERKVPFTEAAKIASEMGAKPFDTKSAYAKYLTDWDSTLKGAPMNYAGFLAQFEGTSTPPAGAQVRKQQS